MMTDEASGFEQAQETQAVELKAQYEGLKVVDKPTMKAMEAFHNTAKDNITAISEHMDPQIKEANAKHKKLTGLKKRLLAPFEAVKKGSKQQCLDYIQMTVRIQQEKRLEAEKKAREEAEERRLEEAERLAELGRKEEADSLLDAPPAPVVVAPEEPIESNLSKREHWSAEVISVPVLIKAASKDAHLQAFLEPNKKALDAFARSSKGLFDVPGCRATMKMV